jgi:hypothetical protein
MSVLNTTLNVRLPTREPQVCSSTFVNGASEVLPATWRGYCIQVMRIGRPTARIAYRIIAIIVQLALGVSTNRGRKQVGFG